MRVTSDLWVSAFVRRSHGQGTPAFVVRRGATEAGAIFVICNRLDGSADLYGPAPQALVEGEDLSGRSFECLLETVAEPEIAERLASESRFDPDIWIVEVESRDGAISLDI